MKQHTPIHAKQVRSELHALASSSRAKELSRFFKTGPGDYGEGDRFLGVRMPDIRRIARSAGPLPVREQVLLLQSPWHEERMLALILWSNQYPRAPRQERERITRSFLRHVEYINNWDLIDVNAPLLVGSALLDREAWVVTKLDAFIHSRNLWKRRIALLATFRCIREKDFEPSLRYAESVLDDSEDLIHKAAGWMLREIGKKDLGVLRSFLKSHHRRMPRTMLRYAIERLPAQERRKWMEKPGRTATQKKREP